MLKRFVWRAGLAALLLGLSATLLTGCFLLPNRPPVALFTVQYDTTDDPMFVVLDATTSSDPDGDVITTYMWSFVTSDPEGPAIIEPLAFSAVRSTATLQLRYPAEDASQIQLVVVDERGAMSDPFALPVQVPNIAVAPTQ